MDKIKNDNFDYTKYKKANHWNREVEDKSQ